MKDILQCLNHSRILLFLFGFVVFLDAISILNIEKQANQINKVKSYYDVDTVAVPNYIGINKKDINKYNFNISYTEKDVETFIGSGARVLIKRALKPFNVTEDIY